jgi:hypothetical protein
MLDYKWFDDYIFIVHEEFGHFNRKRGKMYCDMRIFFKTLSLGNLNLFKKR